METPTGSYLFRVLIIEATSAHAKLLSSRIRRRQLEAGHREDELEIKIATNLSEAAFIVRHDQEYDCIYLDLEGLAPPERHTKVLEGLSKIVKCPIKVVVRGDSPVSEKKDPRTSVVNKNSLEQIDASLQALVSQMNTTKKLATTNGVAAAIARLEVEVQNLWRENGEIQSEQRDQLVALRTAIQSLQDQTFLRVDNIPVKIENLSGRIIILEGRIDNLTDSIRSLNELMAAISAIAKTIRFIKKNWVLLGGPALISLGFWLYELFKN